MSDCADADIVIITAGARPIPGQSRLSELGADIDIVDPILKSVMASGFDGMLIMVSNPVDVLAWFAWKRTGLPSRQVIGTGTALDTARMKTIIAERTHLDPRTVGDYVIGEHGDSQFIPWSTVNIVGKPFARYLSDNAAKYPDVTLDGIERPLVGAVWRSKRSKAVPTMASQPRSRQSSKPFCGTNVV